MNLNLKKKWTYLAGGVIVLIIILFEAQGKGDFNIFISASKDLMLKKNIYSNLYNEYYHYYYDVLFALVLVPFTYIPLYITKVIWLLVNLFFLYKTWEVLKEWLSFSLLERKTRIIISVLTFIFILRFLRDNFHLAQMTIFILFTLIYGLYLIEQKKMMKGTLLIALGINIKLLPLVILPYLIYRREFKSFWMTLLFMIILLFLPALILGIDYNKFLLSERWKIINPLNHEHILDVTERSFHSISTLLATLLVNKCGNEYTLDIKRNIFDISIPYLNIIINIVRAILILLTLYFIRSKPFTKPVSKIQKLYEISYICIIIPLIFPHQQHYAFLFIFPAIAYLMYFVVIHYQKFSRIKKNLVVSGLLIIYFLTNSHFILGTFNKYYDHFKTLTYGVLFLIILLAIFRPSKLSKINAHINAK